MSLSDQELERYARHIVLPQMGGSGQRRLKSAKVALIGAGGIGSAAIPALAGAGVGRISIVDDGAVDESNLQRQTIFRTDQIGEPKARLAAEYARALNPNVEAVAIEARIGRDNGPELLEGQDLVLDGSDNFATRLAVSDTAVHLGIPLVSGAGQQFQGQAALFTARPCYRCFVGDAFDTDDCDNCSELGVLGALTGVIGNMAALLAIRHLAGIGSGDGGTLHLFDALAMRWRAIAIAADPACRSCGDVG